jgi:flagellar basal body-associated protein FliL
MYQQNAQRPGGSSKGLDTALIIIFIVIVLFAREISNVASSLPSPINVIVQIFLLGAIVGVLLWVYEKRISTFRYTVVYDPYVKEEGDESTEPLPYKKGTLMFERMVANKGKLVECVTKDEFVALMKPGEKYSEGVSFLRASNLSTAKCEESYTLIFRRSNKLYSIMFAPDEEFLKRLNEAMEG